MSATLNGTVRDKLGSRYARRLRLQNRIPCSIQGEDKANVDISIDVDEFLTARRHHEHLFDITLGSDTETAMVRELQWDLLGQDIVHVEFQRVVRGRKTEVEAELVFIGHPKGGVLNHLVTHVTVLCLPSEIPDNIEVRVDGLEPGHPIFAKDLQLPENVDLAIDSETQVAVVSAVRAIEEEVPEEGDELGIEGIAAIPAGEEPKPEGE